MSLASSLLHLARCATPAGASGRVKIADALAAAAGGGGLLDVSRLPRLDALSVPVAPSWAEGSCLDRYESYYVPLPAADPEVRDAAARGGGCGGGGGGAPGAKLLVCVDDAGVRPRQLLRCKPDGSLDVRRDALLTQARPALCGSHASIYVSSTCVVHMFSGAALLTQVFDEMNHALRMTPHSPMADTTLTYG